MIVLQIIAGIIVVFILSVAIWFKVLRCVFYPHIMKRSHPECKEKCEYCGLDHNELHFHINKNKNYE